MRLKRFFATLLGLTAASTLALTSCSNERFEEVEVPSNEKYKVTTEAVFMDEDGSVQKLDLRAIDSPKGTITGDGLYDYNAQVTVKATAKSPYVLHQLYEKNGKEGFTVSAGTVNGATKSLTFNIKSDMHFIAVFMSAGGTERGYRNLKLNGKLANHSYTINGNISNTTTVTAVGEEVSARKTADGTIIDWNNVVNSAYKAWTVPAITETWLKPTINASTGVVTLVAQPYISKTGGVRKATVRVGKDGSTTAAPKAWRTITITQNSYYEANEDASSGKVVNADGTSATLPATLTYAFPATGGTKDLKTLHATLGKTMYVLVPTYKNGQLQPESAWTKKALTTSFGNPSATWVTKSGTNYSAGVNNTSAARSATIKVNFNLGSKLVHSTTVTVTQAKKQYQVGGEIK